MAVRRKIAWRRHARDVTGLFGAALITYGAGLIYRPLEFIIGGGFALLAGILLTLSAAD